MGTKDAPAAKRRRSRRGFVGGYVLLGERPGVPVRRVQSLCLTKPLITRRNHRSCRARLLGRQRSGVRRRPTRLPLQTAARLVCKLRLTDVSPCRLRFGQRQNSEDNAMSKMMRGAPATRLPVPPPSFLHPHPLDLFQRPSFGFRHHFPNDHHQDSAKRRVQQEGKPVMESLDEPGILVHHREGL